MKMLSLVNTLKNNAYIDYDGLTSRIRSIELELTLETQAAAKERKAIFNLTWC